LFVKSSHPSSADTHDIKTNIRNKQRATIAVGPWSPPGISLHMLLFLTIGQLALYIVLKRQSKSSRVRQARHQTPCMQN